MRPERAPSEIARDALLRIRKAGLAPTPENFCAAWRGAAGEAEGSHLCTPVVEVVEACDSLAALLRLVADSTAGAAARGGPVRDEIARLVAEAVPPWEAAKLRALEAPLRRALDAESAMRAEMATAKQGLKEVLGTIIGRIHELSGSTGQFADRVDDFTASIEKAGDVESLAVAVKALAGDTRQMKEGLATTRRELEVAGERVRAQDARMVELETQLAQASEQVRTDALTGALNRRGFEEAWSLEHARALREGGALSLAVIDLDDFKKLNDTHGHAAGDHALVHLVALAHRLMRPTDRVARMGGEEFALILPGTGLEEATAATARLQRGLTREEFLGDNQHLFITFSAGVAEWQAGEGWVEVLARADAALYEAKRQGKNRVLPASGTPAVSERA
jgi:diguanylate cyclase